MHNSSRRTRSVTINPPSTMSAGRRMTGMTNLDLRRCLAVEQWPDADRSAWFSYNGAGQLQIPIFEIRLCIDIDPHWETNRYRALLFLDACSEFQRSPSRYSSPHLKNLFGTGVSELGGDKPGSDLRTPGAPYEGWGTLSDLSSFVWLFW